MEYVVSRQFFRPKSLILKMLFDQVVANMCDPRFRLKPMPPKEIPPYHVILSIGSVGHPLLAIYEAIFICRMAGVDRLEDDIIFMHEVGAHWSAFLDLTPENQKYFISNLPTCDSTTKCSVLTWSLERTQTPLEAWRAPKFCDGWKVKDTDGQEFEIVVCDD